MMIMEQVNWQTVITMIVGLVVPIVIFGSTIWAKIGRLEIKLDGTVDWLKKVEVAPHVCPHVATRTEHHSAIAEHDRRLNEFQRWREEIDRMFSRLGQHHGKDSEA
jgi:hypothetical protein